MCPVYGTRRYASPARATGQNEAAHGAFTAKAEAALRYPASYHFVLAVMREEGLDSRTFRLRVPSR
jgi:hypothetical protein